MLRVSAHGATDQGRRRRSNQDQFLIASLAKSMTVSQSSIPSDDHARFESELDGHLFLVADGMGGHEGGEVASRIAIDAATEYVLNTLPWFYRLTRTADEDFRDELTEALRHSNNRLLTAQQADPARGSMATTLTMAYFVDRWLFVVHAGDSRCYLARGGQVHQLTRDHSLAQAMVDAGRLDEASAATSPMSHCLYNSIGGNRGAPFIPDIAKAELAAGDVLLLCTDGLTRHVADDRILDVIAGGDSPEAKNRELIELANTGGGADNITVVLAEFSGART